VFLDIGANVGLFSMLASRWVGPQGRVFSFEPSAREFARLQEHVTLNDLRNVTAIRKAVADARPWLNLRVAQFPHAGHNTTADRFAYDAVAVNRIERVQGITLDEFVLDTRISRVDLVKVDVEGGESSVMDGAKHVLETYRPAWIVEISESALANQRHSAGEVLQRFKAASYRILSRVAVAGGNHDLGGNVIAVPAERIGLYGLQPRSKRSLRSTE
jgi:FkbM family methyltransferase